MLIQNFYQSPNRVWFSLVVVKVVVVERQATKKYMKKIEKNRGKKLQTKKIVKKPVNKLLAID